MRQEEEREGAPEELPIAWRRGGVYTGPGVRLSAKGNNFVFMQKSLTAEAADTELYSTAGVVVRVAHSGGSGGNDDISVSPGFRILPASLLLPGGASSTASTPLHLRGRASSLRRRTSDAEGIEKYRHRHRLPPQAQAFDVTAYSLQAADGSSAATPAPSQSVSSSSSWSSLSAAPSSAPSSAQTSEPQSISYELDATKISLAVALSTVLLLFVLAVMCRIMGASRKRRTVKETEVSLMWSDQTKRGRRGTYGRGGGERVQ